MATSNARSTARSLITGRLPGMPRRTGQGEVFGSAAVESTPAQPQNIFERVRSSACTSRPTTASQSMDGFSLAPRLPVPVHEALHVIQRLFDFFVCGGVAQAD